MTEPTTTAGQVLRWHRFGSSGSGEGWYATLGSDTRIVAQAVKTGSHLDDYPWDWYLPDGASGVADTLRSAKSKVRAALDAPGTADPYVAYPTRPDMQEAWERIDREDCALPPRHDGPCMAGAVEPF